MKKKTLILILLSTVYLAGCSMLSLVLDSTNPNRHSGKSAELNKLYAVKEGMTKDQVIQEWGYPYKKKTEDSWIYYFPEIMDQKIYLTFQDDSLVKIKSSPKDWWWF